MAPEADGMAEFVQCRGLKSLWALIAPQQHRYRGFQSPLTLAQHPLRHQAGPSVACPQPAVCVGSPGRAASLDADLGGLRIAHPHDRHQGGPLIQGTLHGRQPDPVPAGGGFGSCRRLYPHAPEIEPWPAQGGGAQPMPIIRSPRRTPGGCRDSAPRSVRIVAAHVSAVGLGDKQIALHRHGEPLTSGRTGDRLPSLRGEGARCFRMCDQCQRRGIRENQGQRQDRDHQTGRPTPRAIRAASRGMVAKPASSMLRIQASRCARPSLTWGSSPLRRGMAHRM